MPVTCSSRAFLSLTAILSALLFGSLAVGAFGATADVGEAFAEEAVEDDGEFASPTRHDRIGRIVAPVMINGRGPFRLVVDTGASHSSLSEQAAQLLGLMVSDASTVVLNGVTGSAIVPFLTIEHMQTGDLVVERSKIAVIGNSMLAGTDGVLGMAGMRTKRLSVDFRRDLVVITSSRRAESDAFLRIPVKRLGGGILAVRARVRGVPTHAVIDTGASHTFANPALCEALQNKKRRRGKISDPIEVFGATPEVSYGRIQRVPVVQLGNDVVLNDIELICGDFHIFKVWELQNEPTMVVGMDVLGAVDSLVIDFARPSVLIRPRTRTPYSVPIYRGR